MEARGEGVFTFGGLEMNPSEQKGLLESGSLPYRTPSGGNGWLQA